MLQTVIPSDYIQGGQVIFTPGGPDEITTQLQVQDDTTLEANEILLLTLLPTHAANASGARIGVRSEARVTIINDDSKPLTTILLVNHFLCYSSGPGHVSTTAC